MTKNKKTPWELYKEKMGGEDPMKWIPQPEPEVVDADVYEERLNICFGCEKLDMATTVCTVCRCEVHEKNRLATSYCPIHKWINTAKLDKSIEYAFPIPKADINND
jgi:hypothetical protein